MVTSPGRDRLWFEDAAGGRAPADDGWIAGESSLAGVPHDPGEFPVAVRPLGLRDLPRLWGLEAMHAVNQPDALVLGNQPLRNASRAALPGQRGKRPAFVAESGDRIVGYAGFRSAFPDGRWLLHALGASVGVYAAGPVWERMLDYAARQAGLRGVRTLYARLPWIVGAGEALARCGWSPYASETVFQCPDARGRGRSPLRPRPQEPADTWAIHQLYAAVTPRAVQQAEALTSRRWELPRSAPRRGPSLAGLVFEADGAVIAYTLVLRGDRSRSVELLVHPDHRDAAADVVDGTLIALGTRGSRRTWWTIRGYQSELAGPLQQCGFAAAFEQDLLVRYTTATVRRAAAEPAHFTLDVRERVPGRMPTFLHGAREDRSAG
ncbi:MAG: hypothetical protein ACKOWF_04980 [Chloroflexota bacterium]